MEDQIEELKQRVIELEKKIHGYKVGALVFGLAISMFLFFQWTEIPKKIDEELGKEVRAEIEKAAVEARKIISLSAQIRERGSDISHKYNKADFWNRNSVNTIGRICDSGQFLSGLEIDMTSLKGVRTPTRLILYCAPKIANN